METVPPIVPPCGRPEAGGGILQTVCSTNSLNLIPVIILNVRSLSSKTFPFMGMFDWEESLIPLAQWHGNTVLKSPLLHPSIAFQFVKKIVATYTIYLLLAYIIYPCVFLLLSFYDHNKKITQKCCIILHRLIPVMSVCILCIMNC